MDIRKCHTIAVRMLGYTEGDEELLHITLANRLTELDNLCRNVGREIQSTQIVAMVLINFKQQNLGVKLIGE